MRFGLRERIAVAGVAAAGAALVAVLVLILPALRRRALEHTREAIADEARLIARFVEGPLARGHPSADVDQLVDAVARESTRVTIIAPDGRVIADSTLSGDALAAAENNGQHPEVIEAQRGRVGTAVRASPMPGLDLLYVAVPVMRAGKVIGVSRVAVPLRNTQAQAREVSRSVLAVLALAFAGAVALALALSAPLARPMRKIIDAANRIAAGDLSARTEIARADEIGDLGRAFDHMVDELQTYAKALSTSHEDLQRAELFLQSVVTHLPLFLSVKRVGDLRHIQVNPEAERITGIRREDFVGKTNDEVYPPQVAEMLDAHDRFVVDTGQPLEVEAPFPSPLGTRILHTRKVPISDAEGRLEFLLTVKEDVTEQRQTEEELRQAKA